MQTQYTAMQVQLNGLPNSEQLHLPVFKSEYAGLCSDQIYRLPSVVAIDGLKSVNR